MHVNEWFVVLRNMLTRTQPKTHSKQRITTSKWHKAIGWSRLIESTLWIYKPCRIGVLHHNNWVNNHSYSYSVCWGSPAGHIDDRNYLPLAWSDDGVGTCSLFDNDIDNHDHKGQAQARSYDDPERCSAPCGKRVWLMRVWSADRPKLLSPSNSRVYFFVMHHTDRH